MYIHEYDNWTDFTWNADLVIDMLSEADRAIGFLSGRLKEIGFDTQMQATLENITNDIIYSSEIEGVDLNVDEVRSSIARKLGISIPNEKDSTHYIEGIVEMMLDAIYHYDRPLSDERLFGWHSTLFPNGRSGYAQINVGKYRTEGMKVISGAFGRERVHYVAPTAESVPHEMQKFIDWFNNPEVKPSLVKSAITHFWFVCIHPFDDGNGRIARALSDMVLSQIDKSKFRYFSVSRQICTDKKKYYKVLERVSRNDHDITEWIIWYLQCIVDAVKSADSVLSGILCKTVFWHTHSEVPMSKRQKDMLRIFLDGQQKLTVKNWSVNAKVSHDTAARDIDDLVQKGVLFPTKGQVRNVSYNFIYTKQSDFMQHFSDVAIENRDGNNYISTLFDNTEMLSEKIDDLDILRLRQDEINIEDLVWKYFAWKIED